ncbi:pyruvate dehydrogenase (acetyl-transferring) E1 component subunit alpha [Desulforhopalus sp. 52FAK]
MPRTTVDLQSSIEYLSILDEHGNVDRDHEPHIEDEVLLDLYQSMVLGRRFDERMVDLQRQGRIGTFPPIKGQEASQLGAIFQLTPEDWFVPAFRETAAEIWRGRSLESILLYYNGYNEGAILPKGQKDLPIAIPVSSQILHATGLGYAANYKNTGEIVMVFFGDGATSEGDFHEGLNCAAVYNTPVLFICQNNQWAISVPIKQQTRSSTIAQKALAYGIPGIQVDGNDVLAVYAATKEAAERARNGNGPTLIECLTYRVMMHTTADDPTRYRTDEEVTKWRQKDPLKRFENYLFEKNLLADTTKDHVENKIQERIQKAIDHAEKRMAELGDPKEMFDHLYDQLPPYLHKQKDELITSLDAQSKEVDNG